MGETRSRISGGLRARMRLNSDIQRLSISLTTWAPPHWPHAGWRGQGKLHFKSINNPLQKLHTRMKIILFHLTHRIPTKFHYTRNTSNNMNCPLPAGAFHSIPLFTDKQSEQSNKPTCQKPQTSTAAYAYNPGFVTTSGAILVPFFSAAHLALELSSPSPIHLTKHTYFEYALSILANKAVHQLSKPPTVRISFVALTLGIQRTWTFLRSMWSPKTMTASTYNKPISNHHLLKHLLFEALY